MKDEKCVLCGTETEIVNLKGERWPYKELDDMEIVVDIFMSRCASCHESYLDEEETLILHEALEVSYKNAKRSSS